jgi:hypothetical protein
MAGRSGGRVLLSHKVQNEHEFLGELLLEQPKESLVELLIDLSMENRALRWRVEDAFDAETPVDLLVNETRQVISEATCFNRRDVNHIFHDVNAAYNRIKKNFDRFILLDRWDELMMLAIELMSACSYQIAMSDESMMTEEVKDCLKPVIAAMAESNIPRAKVISWCDSMSRADNVGYICDRLIYELRARIFER